MSRHDTHDGTDDRTDASARASVRRTDVRSTRRDVLRAAGASAGALALGSAATGTGSAQGDGPGQDIPLPRLETDGNLVVDPDGNTVTLRGLNVADPRRLNATAPRRGKTALQTIDYLTDSSLGWHPRVLRLPIHPGDIAGLTPVPASNEVRYEPVTFTQDELETYCEEHLDPAVERCRERGVYAILDYHRHWGPPQWTGDALDEEVRMFWDYVAERYGDRDHCIFEVYNEPLEPQVAGQMVDQNGDVHEDWLLWRDTCSEWVDIIRDYTDNLVIIGSPNYSQRPEGAVYAPFDFDNVGYTYHIYPGHNISKDNAWDEPDGANESVVGPDGTAIYEEYPLFVTEFGWDGDEDAFYLLPGTNEGYGDPFLEFLESSPAIHWTAWCADVLWRPPMFGRAFADEDPEEPELVDSVNVNPYEEELPQDCASPPCDWELLGGGGDWMGVRIKEALSEYRDHNVPQTGGSNAPSPPSDLEATVVETLTVELAWSGVADADSYVVYRGSEPVETTAETTAVVELPESGTWELGVASSNADGESTATTATVSIPAPSECGSVPTQTIDGQLVCDLDEDGYYRDVTGDGDLGQDDVVSFFEVQHRSAWKQDAFDFSGNGEVNQFDVVELFDHVLTN